MLIVIRAQTLSAFAIAADEPKLTSREHLNDRVSRPLAGSPVSVDERITMMPLTLEASGPAGQVNRS